MKVGRSIPVLVLLVGMALSGCDAVNEYIPTGGGKPEAVERERLVREREAAAEQTRVEGERTALRRHIEASCRVLEAAIADGRRKSEEAKTDREALSARIRELSSAPDENGRTPERHVVLSGLLADDRVNELAAKYMDRNFRMIRLEFIEAMRTANGKIRRRDAALDRNKAAYDKSIADIADDAAKSQQASQDSAANLRRTIAALEKKEKDLQRMVSMSAGVSDVRRRKEQELRDVSNRLRDLHRDYDALRTNRAVDEAASRTARRVNTDRERVQMARERADAHVVRLFPDVKAPEDITSECEKITIGELERRMVAAEKNAMEGTAGDAGNLDYLKSLCSGLDNLNVTALQRMRTDVDRRLSGTPEKK